MSLIQIANLTKTYYMSDELSSDVLKGIDCHFEKGEMVALLGESGCGKSTLLNILGGLDSEFGGSVIYNGEFMKDFTPEQIDDYRKSRVGIVFQGFNLITHLTALENVILPMKMANWDTAERKARAKELLRMMGLKRHMNKLPNQLSGGQRQRVAIARALANNPDVILADEPTGNLDKESAAPIIKILQEIAENNKLVIVVTHSEAVAQNCSRIITMDDGRFISSKINDAELERRVRDRERAERKARYKSDSRGAKNAEQSKAEQSKAEQSEQTKAEQSKQNNQSAQLTPEQDGEEEHIRLEESNRNAQNISNKELLRFAATNLWHQRSRSIFVSAGTSVGIIALIIMLALSVGLRGYINNQVLNNVNLLQINVVKNGSNGGISGDNQYFQTADITYLESMDYVDRVETSTTLNLAASYSFTSNQSSFTGEVLTLTGAHNSFVPELVAPDSRDTALTSSQIYISKSLANRVLTGTSVGDVVFSSLLGKTITIKMNSTSVSKDFIIAGVIENDEVLNSFASVVVSNSALKELSPDSPITNVYVFAESASRLDVLMENLNLSLYSAYRVDTTIEDILYYINLGTGVLVAVCAISLIVSAIMIYIVMNISITERTKEIGILRAIGARQKDVRNIFIFESGMLGLAAGLIAVCVCYIISGAANVVFSVEMGAVLISLNPLIYIGGLVVGVLVSVFSGLIPANRASDADPVDSLRRE